MNYRDEGDGGGCLLILAFIFAMGLCKMVEMVAGMVGQ